MWTVVPILTALCAQFGEDGGGIRWVLVPAVVTMDTLPLQMHEANGCPLGAAARGVLINAV